MARGVLDNVPPTEVTASAVARVTAVRLLFWCRKGSGMKSSSIRWMDGPCQTGSGACFWALVLAAET